MLRTALNINQWCSIKYCVKWFRDYDKNDKCSFIKYDIRDFYLCITEKAVDKVLKLAKEYIVISEDKTNIIKHCHKSIQYQNEELWIKKDVCGNFDNPMGSFDRAKLSQFIGCLLLYNLNSIIDSCNHELYMDYGLIIVDNCMLRKGNMIRKKLHRLFNKFGFKLYIQTNLEVTDYLDDIYQPLRLGRIWHKVNF